MAAFAPPIPSAPGAGAGVGAPPVPGGPPAGLSGLVGATNAVPAGPTPQQRMADYMNQVRELHMQIDALAQDHPEAADDLNQAKNALTNSMSKVASASASPDAGPQPPVV